MAPRIITPRRSALPAAVLPSARHWPCRRASRSSLRTRSSAMSTNQSRASGPLTCASTSSSPTLTVGCSKTSGSVNWNRSARPLSEALGAPGLRARARLSVWMKSPGSPCTRNCAYSPRSIGPSGRAAQDSPRTARSEVSSVNLPWSSCSQARPLRRPATGAPAPADQPAAPDRRPADRSVRSSWRGCPRRPKQAAIELGPQVQLPRQLAGRGAQRESVRQPAVARQEFHVAQRQFRRLAQLVLPADDGAMDQQFTLRGQPAQRGMLQPGRGAALVVQVDRHAGDPEAVLRVAAQVQFGLVEPQLQQPGDRVRMLRQASTADTLAGSARHRPRRHGPGPKPDPAWD